MACFVVAVLQSLLVYAMEIFKTTPGPMGFEVMAAVHGQRVTYNGQSREAG